MMTRKDRGSSRPADAAEGENARLNRDIQSKIGEGLRAMYDDVVKQGVPDRFLDLLKQLDRQGGEKEESRQK